MTPEEIKREAERRLSRPLPPAHALNFYAVLGRVEGMFMMLGYSHEDAERRAVATLLECKPQRRRRR